MFHVSSVDKSDCTGSLGELGGIAIFSLASEIGFSYSHSHALTYKSSCLRLNSVSRFDSCGVIGMSGGV